MNHQIIFSAYKSNQYPTGLAHRAKEMAALTGLPCAESHEDCDREHWLESLALLEALKAETDLPIKVVDYQDLTPNEVADRVLFGVTPTRWGGYIFDATYPRPVTQHAALNYAHNPAFEALAGRGLELADTPPDSAPMNTPMNRNELRHVLAEAKGKKFIKFIASAKALGNAIYDPEIHTPDVFINLVYNYSMLMYADLKDAFLVQDFVTMTCEHRFFIVNSTITGASPCVESYTPFDIKHDNVVDSSDTGVIKVGHEVIRGDGEIATLTDAEFKSMLKFVGKANRELSAADANLTDYVLDVAMIEGNWCVIELNPLQNSGMFALNVNHFVRAVLKANNLST